MEILALFIIAISSIGYLSGYLARRWRIRTIRRSTTQKAAYELVQDLSPAEFGYIIDGKFDAKEVAAELVVLYTRGFINVLINEDGSKKIVKNVGQRGRLTDMQTTILKQIPAQNGALFYSLVDDVRYAAEQSLIKKGWIVHRKRPISEIDLLDIKSSYRAICLLLLLVAPVIWFLCFIFGVRGTALQMTPILYLTALFIVSFIIGLILLFKGKRQLGMGIVFAASPTFARDWKDIYGVYEYIRVSGMDTFTPNYENYDFTGLDKLYPYAVAAGLDKKIISMFS